MRLLRIIVALALLLPSQSSAWRYGSGTAPSGSGKSVLNADFNIGFYNNVIKQAGCGYNPVTGPPTNASGGLNSDGYPVGTNNADINCDATGSTDVSYYGRWRGVWTGVGAFGIFSPISNVIVYSGGAAAFGITPNATGTNLGLSGYNNSNQTTNGDITFSFGALLATVTTHSGLVEFTTAAGGVFNMPTGYTVKCNTTGLGTGPNGDGSWTITNVDGDHTFDLQGSGAYAGLVSVTGTGGPGVQSECLANAPQLVVSIPNSGSATSVSSFSMSNLMVGEAADIADLLASGHQIKSSAISFAVSYNEAFDRWMDGMAAQSFYANFSDIPAATSLSYASQRWYNAYYAGTTGGSGDNFTVTNSSSGAYVDGETVQFVTNRGTTGYAPTFQVNSRGQVPILSETYVPLYITATGTPTTGDVVSVVFSGQFSHTTTYTVLSSDTTINTLLESVAGALNADAFLTANGFNCGFTGSAAPCYFVPSKGALATSITVSGSATETFHPGTFLNTSGLINATGYTLIYNALLGGFTVGNANGSGGLFPSLPLTVITELATRTGHGVWLAPSAIFSQSGYASLGTYFATNMPGLLVLVEHTNEVWNFSANPTGQAVAMGRALGFDLGSGSSGNRDYQDWYGLRVAQNLPAFSAAYVAAGGSLSSVKLLSMDTVSDGDGSYSDGTMICCRWNGIDLAGTPASFSGAISGNTTLTVTGNTGAIWPSLTLNGTCVTAGTKILSWNSGTQYGNGVYTLNQSNTNGSCSMTVTNPVYAAISGPGGTSSTTAYNAFPTRPIDLVDYIGFATYWNGALAGQGAASWSGTQSNYNVLFQASLDYFNGNTSSALSAWDNDINNGALANNCNSGSGCQTICAFLQGSYTTSCPTANTGGEIRAYEADTKLYDGARPSGKANLGVVLYEGSIQQTLAANSFSGSSKSTSPTELATQFDNNGWDLSAYGTGGCSGATACNLAVATNIVNLQFAYFSSSNLYNTQLNFWNAMRAIFSDRPIFAPAQFGITGTQTNPGLPVLPLWGIFPGSLASGILQNGAAQEYYNTH